jgi:hypothetical protein
MKRYTNVSFALAEILFFVNHGNQKHQKTTLQFFLLLNDYHPIPPTHELQSLQPETIPLWQVTAIILHLIPCARKLRCLLRYKYLDEYELQ